ncbi:phage holin family protein [Luteimonas sp. A478]
MNDDHPDSAGAQDAAGPAGEAPHLDESVRRVTAAGRQTLASGRDAARALRRLFRADLALARAALGRAAVWLALTVVFGTSAWLLTITFLVILLHSFGLSWLASALIAAALNFVITALAAWRVVVYARHTGLQATRRQLNRLGLLQDDEDEDEHEDNSGHPGAGAPVPQGPPA